MIYRAMGLMSGTSLDGLDILEATFEYKDRHWKYSIDAVDCIPYKSEWKEKLSQLNHADIATYVQTDVEYGQFLGHRILEFRKKYRLTTNIDVIGSHGHTILHNPSRGYTLQLGSGAHIAYITGFSVVSDLRISDVAAGGQGAPIVPIGERHLYSDIIAFLNIGGIANISFHDNQKVIAYDVCPGNTPINKLIQSLGLDFDDKGQIARNGVLNKDLLSQLEQFSFYKKSIPRSLHTDTIVKEFMPIINSFSISIEDKLHTVIEHIAQQISHSIQKYASDAFNNQIMITGGGTKNSFLIERIKMNTDNIKIILPSIEIIDFKEALIMAFFAILRLRGEENCLSSVTGASKNVCGGALYLG